MLSSSGESPISCHETMIRSSLNTCHERWANLHPLVRFLVLAAAVAGVGFFGVKPGYREFKGWRMEQNLRAARKAVDEVRMNEARDLSLTVLRAGDPRIEAFRILEKSTASLRDPQHAYIARALLTHPEGTDEDRLNGFRGIVVDAPLGLVGQAWTMLPPASQKDPRFATAFADRLIAGRRLNEAASLLLAVPTAARDAALDRDLVRVLIGSGRREGFDEAQRMIASGSPAAGSASTAWLDLLEEIPAESLRENWLGPLRGLLENPSTGDPARAALMLTRIEYAAQINRRAEVLETAIQRWKESAPEELARFLSQLGLYHLLLEAIPAERVRDHPGLFPLVLDALEKTGTWPQVAPLLDEHGHLIPKSEELAHRSILASKTGDSAGRAQAWTAAMNEAKSSPLAGPLLKLNQLATAAGNPDLAEQALVEAIRLGRGPLPLYADLKPLLNSLASQGRETTLLEICAIYLAFEPANPILLTQYAYLACLNQLAEPVTILKAMIPLAKAFPQELPIQCVLATVYLCAGQNAMAAETLDRLHLDPATLAPGYRAAFLTTQVLVHRMAKDNPLLTDFPWLSLQPSERKKFSELLRAANP